MDGVVHRTSAPRCTWAASTSAVKSTSENVLFFQFHPSLCLAPSLSSPNKQAFLVIDNEPCFFFYFSSYHFRTFSIAAITLLMSSFALLRVSARTDLPDIAAVGIIFLKLAGSSDTMQTVERTEEPIAPARVDRAARGGGAEGCSCTQKSRLPAEPGGEQRGCKLPDVLYFTPARKLDAKTRECARKGRRRFHIFTLFDSLLFFSALHRLASSKSINVPHVLTQDWKTTAKLHHFHSGRFCPMSLFVTVHLLQTSDISLESICVFWPCFESVSHFEHVSGALCSFLLASCCHFVSSVLSLVSSLSVTDFKSLYTYIVYLDLFCMSLVSLNHDLVPPWPCFGCPHNVYNVYCIAVLCLLCILCPLFDFSVSPSAFTLFLFYFDIFWLSFVIILNLFIQSFFVFSFGSYFVVI